MDGKEWSGDHMSFVDTERCFPQFADHCGCAVCISECPFNEKPYEEIRVKHVTRNRTA